MDTALRRFPFQAMGSFCEIQLLEPSRIEARTKVRKMLGEVNRLEQKYSRYNPASLLSEINAMAGSSLGIKLDTETRSLFDHALSCYQQSDGLFDITAGVLRRIWDFSSGKVPNQAEIDRLLPHIGLDKLTISKSRLVLPAGMEIDFGGIVKEYAADSVARLGRSLGIDCGLVNLGGDFAVIGPLPDDRPWPVGISHPEGDSKLMARLLLRQGGLASSGDYERCFIHQGKRYSHILNPRTGWPCDGLRAVSVSADTCTVAGSIATIAMLKPEQQALSFLQELGVDHVYMSADAIIDGSGFSIDSDSSHAEVRS
ncbi:MAG: FAD:protein FMN transferase, partial [Gammaproteobacteria bacterium]|nr:FAD:protein FMN transferase [Gammaproteobacteria bacterium]